MNFFDIQRLTVTGNLTGNLRFPIPVLYRPCYSRLILFNLIYSCLRKQQPPDPKRFQNKNFRIEKLLKFSIMDFRCTCYILLILGTITRANKKTKKGYTLSKAGSLGGQETGASLTTGRTRFPVAVSLPQNEQQRQYCSSVFQFNHTCKWVMSSWTRRFDNPDEVTGLEISIWFD